MPSKSKGRSKARSAPRLVDQVKRSLERGDFKQALKDGRTEYRQHPTPECRCFLEHAYAGRATQLWRCGQVEDARRVARELLEFGVTELSVKTALPELLLGLGLSDWVEPDALGDEDLARIRIRAADQAVVRLEHLPASMRDLRDDAQRVRAALRAIERGEESIAWDQLKQIPRQSIFADWRFLVRGLAAHYRREDGAAEAQWNRLDPDRAAARIAAALRADAGSAPAANGEARRGGHLRSVLPEQTILTRLERVRDLLSERNWGQALNVLRQVRAELLRVDPDLERRVRVCVCGDVLQYGGLSELTRLSRIVDPLPLDPHWNRAKAVVNEKSDERNLEDAERYWSAYLKDLDEVTELSVAQCDIARGLVWLRLADTRAEGSFDLRDCRCGADHSEDIRLADRQTLHAFEQGLARLPDYAQGYYDYALFCQMSRRPKRAVEVHRRLLERLPDNWESLLFLGKHYLTVNDPLEARKFFQRARGVKPLDGRLTRKLWETHLACARARARRGEFEPAREELAAADRLVPSQAQCPDMLARKVLLEIKAGQAARGKELLARAREQFDDLTVFWLIMAIEGADYELPKEEHWLYEVRWRKTLKRRCRGETAGTMCRIIGDLGKRPGPVPHRNELLKELLAYLRRCSRVEWQLNDLRSACELLDETEQDPKLMGQLVGKGCKLFPDVAVFHWWSAQTEFERGPMRFDHLKVIAKLRRVVQLAAKSDDPRDKELIKKARRVIDFVDSFLL